MCQPEETQFWEDLRSGKFACMVKESVKGRQLSCATEVYNVLKPMYAEHTDVEVVYGVFLDAKNNIQCIEALFTGSLSGATFYPREVLKKVLARGSSAMIISHNHPSGSTTPSMADFMVTTKLAIALDSIEAVLHDHMIIGNGYHSMANSGAMAFIMNKIKDFASSCCSECVSLNAEIKK